MSGLQGSQLSTSAQNVILHIGIEKKCSKCGEIKNSTLFYSERSNADGLRNDCKMCKDKSRKKWRSKNRERVNATHNLWLSNHPGYKKEFDKKWFAENREKERERDKEWRLNNRDKKRKHMRKCNYKKRATAEGHLSTNISNAIRHSLQHGQKGRRKWETLVGYSLQALKAHIEKKFSGDMNWDNYGSYWTLDHKIPVSVFNFACPDDIDFKRCWELKNLQPMEKIANIIKRDKLSAPFQPAFIM
jgi:hypothetical protein